MCQHKWIAGKLLVPHETKRPTFLIHTCLEISKLEDVTEECRSFFLSFFRLDPNDSSTYDGIDWYYRSTDTLLETREYKVWHTKCFFDSNYVPFLSADDLANRLQGTRRTSSCYGKDLHSQSNVILAVIRWCISCPTLLVFNGCGRESPRACKGFLAWTNPYSTAFDRLLFWSTTTSSDLVLQPKTFLIWNW